MTRASALRVAVAAAIACNGCIKIEKFMGATDDAGSDPDADGGSGSDSGIPSTPVTVTKTGDMVTVGIQGLYTMVFPASGYHFPNSLTVGGNQVLAPTSASCNNEIGTGVTYYPGGVFNGADTTSFEHIKSDITVTQSGPAVVKVQLDWESEFDSVGSCSGTRPRGRSTFTFFENGRIQRMDAAFLNQEALMGDCSCLTDDHWENVTYYTFDEQYVTAFDGIVDNDPRPGTGASVELEETVCWNGPGSTTIAMAWRASVARRMRRITSNSLSMIADMIPYAMDNALTPPTPSTDPLGDTSTTMWIAKGSNCSAVEPLVAPFAGDKQIEVTAHGTMTSFGLGQDGLYGGEHSQNLINDGIYPQISPIHITPRVGDGDIPAFGVWLQLDNQPNVTSVSQRHTKQPFLDSEGLETGQVLFWFPDGLAQGQTITIVATP